MGMKKKNKDNVENEEKQKNTGFECEIVEAVCPLAASKSDRELEKEWELQGWTIREFKNRNYVELEKNGVIIRVGDKDILKWLWYYDPKYEKAALVILDPKYEEEILKPFQKVGNRLYAEQCQNCPKYYDYMLENL